MARDFTIKNNDVRTNEVIFTSYLSLVNDYAIVVDGYSAITPITSEIVYGPISLQIKGPMSLRQTSEAYKVSTTK